MKKTYFKLVIFALACLAVALTVTPTWAGLITPEAWSATGESGPNYGLAERLALGDFNGDTYPDIAAADRNHNGGQGNGAGAVFVWYGSAIGFGTDGTPANADWVVQGEVSGIYDQFGTQMAVADFNGDTYDDVAIGCIFCNEGNSAEGAVYVYFGSSSGLPANPTKANADWMAHTAQNDAMMGQGYMIAGDVNNDTYPDLIVGNTTYDNGNTNEGAVFVWYGGSSGFGTTGTPANADWMAESNLHIGVLGSSLAVGDVNGDTYTDLAVSRTDASSDIGYVYVWYGTASGLGPNGTLANSDWEAASDQDQDLFGYPGTLVMADFDGSGHDDLAVGASGYDGPLSMDENMGYVFVWEGSATGLGADGTPANADWVAHGESGYAGLGRIVTAGDLSGNGYADLGVIQLNTTPHVLAWYGSDTGLGADGTPANADDTLDTEGNWITIGNALGSATDDLLLADDQYGGNPYTGKLYVYQTDAPPLNPTSVTETGGAQDGVWQNAVSDPAFTWSGASDDSAVDGYYVYFGADPQGTDTIYVSIEAYDPPAVSDGEYYLRISTRDDGGQQAPWETLFTFRYDGLLPENPTGIVELGGALSEVWQNNVNDPSFTWAGASDGHSGVDGYYVYFGEDPAGTATIYITEAAYDPAAVSSGTYYLRIRTQDQAGNQAAWETLFTFQYDPILPTNPTAATELGGAQDNIWQGEVSDPSFDWSGAADVPSGVNGYYVYFGEDPHGTTGTYVFEPAYDPTVVPEGVYYLRVRTQDEAKNQAAWTTLFTFRYKIAWTLFLPLIGYDVPPVVIPTMEETEPNNLFEEANQVDQLPMQINGNHDGATGTGDVFMLDDNLMTAGEVVQATIDTENAAGLQLVVYDPQGQEIARAYDGEFIVSFIVPASGTYYVYVYTDPGVDNRAAYELLIEILP